MEHKRSPGGHILRYEDVLENAPAILKDFFTESDEVDGASHELLTAPQSVQVSAEDLKAVINRECVLPYDVARNFWTHIDPSVSTGLGYTLEEINFSGSFSEGQRLRAAAYKLTEKPETLSDEDFELLLRAGKETFQNDGLVLGQIGTKLFNDGDAGGCIRLADPSRANHSTV